MNPSENQGKTIRRKAIWKSISVILLFLAIPLIPFLLFGEIEDVAEQWLRNQTNKPFIAAATVVLLTVDVLLPIPSSIVCTIAGSSLGPVLGTLFSTLGMTLGALIGFGIGKLCGQRIARKWTSDEERDQLNTLVRRYGISILFFMRPIPLFAEGSLLFLGSTSMSWSVFLWATLPIHFALALLYASLGHCISILTASLLSVGIAITLSIFAAIFVRKASDQKMNEIP